MVMSRHHLSSAQCHNGFGDRQLAAQLFTVHNRANHTWETMD